MGKRKTALQEMLLDLAERADNEAWTRPQVTKMLRLLATVRVRRGDARTGRVILAAGTETT